MIFKFVENVEYKCHKLAKLQITSTLNANLHYVWKNQFCLSAFTAATDTNSMYRIHDI